MPKRTQAKEPQQTLHDFFSIPVPVVAESKESGELEVSEVCLSREQAQVMKLVVEEGKSIFFTGAAGAYYHASGPTSDKKR